MSSHIVEIQASLSAAGLDGWLFADFRGSDPVGASVLRLPRDRHTTRRWYYWLPSRGEPVKLVHAIEPEALDGLPGRPVVYLAWQQLHALIRQTLGSARRVAMQYSPDNALPTVSRVDAGTVELIRSWGIEVLSSADLVAGYEATLSDAQMDSHRRAGTRLGEILHAAFAEIGRWLRAGQTPTECSVQRWLVEQFAAAGLVSDHPPIVAVDAHAADPHFAPRADRDEPIVPGRLLLLDAWGKLAEPGAIYADFTWMAWVGRDGPPQEQERVFGLVRDARDAAVSLISTAWTAGRAVRGCDADDACRAVIQAAGLGQFFIHRTGHSIHETGHGNGVNLDNLETCDQRCLLPRTCFSVEPGIYLPGRFGIRSEINVLLSADGRPELTGPPSQSELLRIEV